MFLPRGSIYSWLRLLVVSYATLSASGAELQSSTERRLQYTPGGIQTGPDAVRKPSYASFARFNPTDGTVVITGGTYGSFFDGNPVDGGVPVSNCFLATARLPTAEFPGLEWIDRTTLDSTVHESCTHLIIHPTNQAILVAGESEPSGFLNELYNGGTTVVSKVTGSLLHFSRAAGTVDLVGGRVMQNAAVMYPHAIANRPGSDTVFVASMESSDGEAKPLRPDLPGMYNPSDFHKFGSSYNMVIQQYTWEYDKTASPDGALTHTLTPGWNEPFATLGDDSVSVSGMVQMRSEDQLVVVGSTSGQGLAFGTPIGSSLDGFVTVISASTGTLLSAARIASLDDMADAITGICVDPSDDRHVYLAGVSQGRMHESVVASTIDGSVQVFIMKWDLVDSRAIWARQIVTRTPSDSVTVSNVKGTACAVSPDGNSLWLAGVVEEGVNLNLSGTETSYGLDDIFVARLNPVDGIVYVTRQIGSESHDSLAANGGLTTDQQGNAIIVGMTHGTFYRQRDNDQEDHSVTDVFVTTVASENGAIAQPLIHSADPGTAEPAPAAQPTAPPMVATTAPVAPTSMPITPTVPATIPPTLPPTRAPQTLATFAPTKAPTNPIVPKTTSVSNGSGIERWVALLLLLLALIIGIIMASFYYYNQKTSSLLGKDAHTDRNKVLSYLGEFDVEDVDLKHSATGGWHCSYTGDLARGRNKKAKGIGGLPGPGLMEASSAHSSVYVDDPLTAPLSPATKALDDKVFLDQFEGSMAAGLNLDALPADGGNASESSSGYDALIDAYNSSINWDDLRRGPGERGLSSSNHGGGRDRGKWGRDIV